MFPAKKAEQSNPLFDDLDYILQKTEGIWEELRGQKIFITGGTGFFGCWLLESFLWANDKLDLGAEALVLTRRPSEFRRKAPHLTENLAIRLLQGDIVNFTFPEGRFPFVIHAATEASAALNEQNPLVMFDTIVTGTRNCLEFARRAGTKKFLLTSSGAIYGRQPPELTHIPEEFQGAPDTMDPRWIYGGGKRCAELLCSTYSRLFGIETKIARCWAFVGPYLPLDIHFAIGNFIRDGLAGGPITIKGDGTPYRSYQYASDLVIWLWTILLKGTSCRPYNVGSDFAITIAEAAEAVAKHFPGVNVVIEKKANPMIPPERYVPSVKRAQDELQLRSEISLNLALYKTIGWHRLRKKEATDRKNEA